MKVMNSLQKLVVFLLMIIFPLLVAGCSYSENQTAMNQSSPDGYNVDDLNNYGDWIHITTYGDAWRPYVVSDWMPYENGYWTYSDAGWTWMSYEPFGWIVYHYGYWYNDPYNGWVWIPSDNQWSPGRVDWIDYGDYVGWAPMPPPGVVYAAPWETRGQGYWEVVRKQDFDKENVGYYRVKNPVRNTMGGREVSNEPPDRTIIQTATGRSVNVVKLPRETVNAQKREIQRVKTPPGEEKEIEQHQERVKEKVLLPRDQYREERGKKNRK